MLQIDPSEIKLPDRGARVRIDTAAFTALRSDNAKLQDRIAELEAEVDRRITQTSDLRAKISSLEFQIAGYRGGKDRRMVEHIAAYIADRHGFTVPELLGEGRVRELVQARHEFFYEAMRVRNDVSIGRLADLIGVDHTSIMAGAARHSKRTGAPRLSRNGINIERKDQLMKLRNINARNEELRARALGRAA
jgi:chromosomal replication initiation ATPase DnaA